MSDLTLTPGTHPIDVAALPQGWRAMQLKDFCTFVQGGRLGLTKQDHYRSSGIPAFSAAGQDGYVEVTEFRNTDAVVLSAIGANCGRCFSAAGDWTTLANVQVVIPDFTEAHARFLHYRVNRDDYWPRSGSAQPFIKPSDIKSCWVALPPIVEQVAVVQALDTLDTAIHQTEAIIAKLKAVKQGLLHDLLTRGIDTNGELRPPQAEAPHLYKQSPLGWIPKEWDVAPTSTRCTLITKGTTPAASDMWQDSEGIRFLRVDNLSFDGQFNLDASTFRVSVATHNGCLARSKCQPGDVLTNIVGPPLGKLGLVTEESGEININQAIALFRPTERLLSRFLLIWLSSVSSQVWLRKRAKQTSGQVNLTLALCQELPLPCMSITEQQAIVDSVLAVQERIFFEAAQLEKMRSEKTGLMDDLLTGRVTPLLTEAEQQQGSA